MAITISLSPEQEKRLAERATQAGQEITAYVHRLIDQDLQAESFDAILAPVRRNFEQSGMTDEDLAALVEEVREDIWREKHDRPSHLGSRPPRPDARRCVSAAVPPA